MSRPDRVASFIQKEISEIISRQIHDPSITDCGLISVTRVEITPDLKLARIYLSFLAADEAKVQAAMEHLRHARGFIKGQLGRVLNLRYMPDLFFIRDTSIAEGVRIFKLLEDLEREDQAKAEARAAIKKTVPITAVKKYPMTEKTRTKAKTGPRQAARPKTKKKK